MTERTSSTAFLKDVVAYVDVWSSSRMEDYSDLFIQQLLDMGAEVSKTLNKQVTHVVFKHGRPSTWKKAQKMGVRIVSVHWVARCKETDEHVDEDLFPAQNEESKLQLVKKRTHRCMQPKDIPIKTPENDRRLKKKIDKMMEELIPSSPVVSDTSPFFIDEQSGSVYSPSLRRSDSMAQRLREMRAQREHLSPSEDMTLDCFSTSHCDPLKKRDKREKQNRNKSSIMKICRKQVNHKSPQSDTALAMCNLACVERNIEVPTLSSKSQQSLESKTTGKKQTTLKSFIYKTCSERKQSPHLNLETESTGISPELSGSLERAKSPLPKNLRNTIYCNSESIKDYKERQTNCKYIYSRKLSSANCCFTENEDNQNNKPIISNPVHKCQHHSSATLHSEVVDDEVFEDYFSPANNALKRRVILFGLSSDEVYMPTFDLEDSNKKGKKGDKRKHKNIDNEHMLVDNSGSLDTIQTIEEIAPETHGSRSDFYVRKYELPKSRFEDIKFVPSAKKQTKVNSAVLSGNKY